MQSSFDDLGDLAALFTSAERELGSFMKAVSDLFGSDQGRLAAEEWLEELESSDVLPGSPPAAWRFITIAAAARLAAHLNAHVTDTKVSPIPSSN